MNILLLVHWFPPTNVIGSVRSYQIARHLADRGHDVRVVHAGGSRFPDDFSADLEGIQCRQVDIGRFCRWLEPVSDVPRFRWLRFIARTLVFPDHYRVLRRRYMRETSKLVDSGFRPDVIISSALPFSMHSLAWKVKQETGASWIADNRDLWAASPYRRRVGWMRRLDRAYERKVLRHADLVVAIGKNMASELANCLGPNFRVVLVRNGADGLDREPCQRTPREQSGPLQIVYTGTLYGGLRDVRPLLEGLGDVGRAVRVDFYRSEEEVLQRYRAEFPRVEIRSHSQLSKAEIKKVQRGADFLLVALGTSSFEKGVLTGKVFEYVEARRPIIAICDQDSELAQIVNDYRLGIASRDPMEIGAFIREQLASGVPDLPAPDAALSRSHQLGILEQYMKELAHEE